MQPELTCEKQKYLWSPCRPHQLQPISAGIAVIICSVPNGRSQCTDEELFPDPTFLSGITAPTSLTLVTES